MNSRNASTWVNRCTFNCSKCSSWLGSCALLCLCPKMFSNAWPTQMCRNPIANDFHGRHRGKLVSHVNAFRRICWRASAKRCKKQIKNLLTLGGNSRMPIKPCFGSSFLTRFLWTFWTFYPRPRWERSSQIWVGAEWQEETDLIGLHIAVTLWQHTGC